MSRARPWYADGLRFECTGCGACCRGPEPGYVLVSEAEVERLAAHLGVPVAEVGRRYLRRLADGELALLEKANLDCIFWEDDRGCSVYEARPDQCRTYPFWPEVVASEATWEAERPACEGIGRGKLYPRAAIERLARNEGATRPGARGGP